MSLISSTDFTGIEVIGFDLDQTLYPKSPKIDEAIQGYIYEKIAQHKGCDIDAARKLFNDLYQGGKGLSGSQTLTSLSIPNPKEVVQEALENADIAEFLQPNPTVLDLLTRLKKRYQNIDLITGSIRSVAEKKLANLALPISLFDQVITGEIGKSAGDAYHEWFRRYPSKKPTNFLYIGDREKSDYIVPASLGIRCILVNILNPNPQIDCVQLQALNQLEAYLLG